MTDFYTRDLDIKNRAISFIQSLPSHKVWKISIKEEKKNLTASQRSFFHKCVDIIADHTWDDPEDIKMRIKYAVLPLREITVNGKIYMIPVSTESLTREQYSQLIEVVLIMGAELGITLPAPQFYGYEL